MKTRSSSVLILAATLSAFALIPSSATAANAPAIGYTVSELALASRGYEKITRGTSRAEVTSSMGHPFRELSPDVWLYSGYHANLDRANEQGCNTLVITFAQDRVVNLKLVNRDATRAIAAMLKIQPKAFIAANK